MKFDMGRRGDFKSETDYLKDVFRRNREAITNVYGEGAESTFIRAVQSVKQVRDVNIRQAVNLLSQAKAFTPYEETAKSNVIEAMKNFDTYQEFRNLTRDEKGRFTKVDMSKLKWDRDSQSYIYNNRVIISFSNSPEGVTLSLI